MWFYGDVLIVFCFAPRCCSRHFSNSHGVTFLLSFSFILQLKWVEYGLAGLSENSQFFSNMCLALMIVTFSPSCICLIASSLCCFIHSLLPAWCASLQYFYSSIALSHARLQRTFCTPVPHVKWCVSVSILLKAFSSDIRQCNSDTNTENNSVNALSTEKFLLNICSKMFQTLFLCSLTSNADY